MIDRVEQLSTEPWQLFVTDYNITFLAAIKLMTISTLLSASLKFAIKFSTWNM